MMNLPLHRIHDANRHGYCRLLIPIWFGVWLAFRLADKESCAEDTAGKPILRGAALVIVKAHWFHNCTATGIY